MSLTLFNTESQNKFPSPPGHGTSSLPVHWGWLTNKADRLDRKVSLPERMVMSAFAGMGGSTICQPLDVIKFQLQVDNAGPSGKRMYNGTFDCARQIVQRNGFTALYAGLSAAYLRQWMYGSGRMGIYSYLFQHHKDSNKQQVPHLPMKLLFGAISGSVGAFIGNPADLALVRMSADSKKPAAERANYKGLVDCINRAVKEDGIAGLWKGSIVTIMRAAVMGSCLMGVTSQTRQTIKSQDLLADDGVAIMVVSSGIASIFACGFSMPMDVIKSRIQNSKSGQYQGIVDCVMKSIRIEGVMVLWRGMLPALIKLTPYTVISLTLLEKITYFVTGSKAL